MDLGPLGASGSPPLFVCLRSALHLLMLYVQSMEYSHQPQLQFELPLHFISSLLLNSVCSLQTQAISYATNPGQLEAAASGEYPRKERESTSEFCITAYLTSRTPKRDKLEKPRSHVGCWLRRTLDPTDDRHKPWTSPRSPFHFPPQGSNPELPYSVLPRHRSYAVIARLASHLG